jgi:uncharacterized hydrophobic protein (TIGR00271 family)
MTIEKDENIYEEEDINQEIDVLPPRPDDFLPTWLDRFRELFSLHIDTDATGTVDNIKKNVVFQGGNLWALIFAALIASIGLNTNSTAVIIGAMLISPLMGPIVGIGYSAGTNDFEFLKTSARNLALMVAISLAASILYFFLSPLKEATPELLARMRPNLYDVLIATFGGAVGIVASSRRDRGTAIPGVAIATALMPPLCTAGYGIASGNFGDAFGAFYLFFINSVFIALTSMLFVRLLGFPQKEFIDKQREKNVRILISAIVALTIIPSIFTAYHVVQEAIFMNRAAVFVEENLKFQNTTILKPFTRTYGSDTALIEVILIGEPLAAQVVESIQNKLEDPHYGLKGTKLVLRQSNNINSYYGGNVSATMVETVFKEKDKTIEEQRQRIAELEKTGGGGKGNTGGTGISQQVLAQLTKKLSAVFPEINRVAYSEALQVSTDGSNAEIVNMVFVGTSKDLDEASQTRIANFIKLEIGLDNIKLVVQ